MKTEEEWLKIYREAWKSISNDGENMVRLKLGKFNDDNIWACIEVLAVNKKRLKEIIKLADKYSLRLDFQGQYEFKLWEDYEDDVLHEKNEVKG